MTKQKALEKLSDPLKKIRECVAQGKYQFSKHALDRVKERGIDVQTTKYILLNGQEYTRKTLFDNEHNNWKYAVQGETIDDLTVRVIVTIDMHGIIIITVIDVQ